MILLLESQLSSLSLLASFQHFSQLTTDDVIAAIRRLPDKQSAADPIPTTMLKQIAEVLAPYITQLFNYLTIWRSLSGSFQGGVYHSYCEEATT